MNFTKLLIILVCMAIAYSYCYFIFPDDVSILQTNLSDFDFNMLQRRQPLVVQDYVADVDNLIMQAWFSPNIVDKDLQKDESLVWNINNHKYCYVYALEDTELILCPPASLSDDGEPMCLAIKMKKSQSVIIPFKWQYGNIKNVKLYGIHDYVTYAYSLIDMII